MKKLTALILALALTLCACAASAEETPGDAQEVTLGTLSLLNMTEEEYIAKIKGKSIALQYLAEQGVYHNNTPDDGVLGSDAEPRVIFYDTLNAILMALEAGEIISAEVPQCTADYLCAHNDNLIARGSFDLSSADDFTKQVAYRLGAGFAFMTTEVKADLRDELDLAITEMKADGTLDALIQTYISDATAEPEPVAFTRTDGKTVRVAITGALPPLDYITPDGTPAGFNTALLAELGRRLNVNFELVVVDSVGRAAALASGIVDLVFWTKGKDGRADGRKEAAERRANGQETEEQRALLEAIDGKKGSGRRFKDVPDGTITTQPYFSDLLIPVALK